MGLVKGKETDECPSSQEVVAHDKTNSARKDFQYPLRFTLPHAQTSQGSYVPVMPLMGGFPYTSVSLPVRQMPNLR